MEKIILYVDDAAYARDFLAKAPAETVGTGAKHWVLVACAPRMTHRISKWVSHSARENWRGKWCDKLFARVTLLLQSRGAVHADLEYVVAKVPLLELTQQLRIQWGAARVVDARRPKFGPDMGNLVSEQTQSPAAHRQASGAMGALGAVLVLAAE